MKCIFGEQNGYHKRSYCYILHKIITRKQGSQFRITLFFTDFENISDSANENKLFTILIKDQQFIIYIYI